MPKIGYTIRERMAAKKAASKAKTNPTPQEIIDLIEELERRIEILENLCL